MVKRARRLAVRGQKRCQFAPRRLESRLGCQDLAQKGRRLGALALADQDHRLQHRGMKGGIGAPGDQRAQGRPRPAVVARRQPFQRRALGRCGLGRGQRSGQRSGKGGQNECAAKGCGKPSLCHDIAPKLIPS